MLLPRWGWANMSRIYQKEGFSMSRLHNSIYFWNIIFFITIISLLTVLLLDKELYVNLVKEGTNTELFTAIFYIISGVLLIISAFKFRKMYGSLKFLLIPLLLGLFFLFVAGEEESWGQWLFGYSVPESIVSLNQQREANIHNLKVLERFKVILDPHRVLKAFTLLVGVLIPIIHYLSKFARRVLKKLAFPVCPLRFLPIFILSFIYEKAAYLLYEHWSHAEIMEFLISFGFFLFSISVIRGESFSFEAVSNSQVIDRSKSRV